MSAGNQPRAATPPTAASRNVLRAIVGALALITTGVVSIAVDRAIYGRGGGEEEEGHAHGDEKGHGEEGKNEKGHDEKGHGDEKGEKAGHEGHDEAHDKEEAGEHKPHEEIASVKLTKKQRESAKLEIVTATAGKVDEVLELPGEVAFDAGRVAHVTPRTEGAVREVRVDLGQEVKKGDVLATLDSREVASMQQEAMATRARRELAEANFKRIEPLFKDGITSEKEFLAAKQALAEAKIDESSAAQKLAAGAGPKATSTGLTLVAPLDGTVVEKHLTVGEVLASNTPAFTVADLSRLWVWSTAHAKDLGRVSKGQRAYVRADGIAAPLTGKVDFVEAMLGERTRTARARIIIDKPAPGWRPGMFVTAELVTGEIDAAVVVRDDALQRVGDHAVVFVEEDGRFEARPIELGRTGRDREGHLVRAVDAGLREGEAYVVRNAFILKAELGKGAAGHEH